MSEEEEVASLANLVESAGSLTPEELGGREGCSVILARWVGSLKDLYIYIFFFFLLKK